MTAQRPGLHPRSPRRSLQNPADRGAIQATRIDVAMAVDRAEQGAGLDVGFLQPATNRADRTCPGIPPEGNTDLSAMCLLIGLGPAKVDDQAVLRIGHIGDLDRRKLGPAKGAGEPGQKQRAIARASQAFRAPPDDAPDIGREQWLLAMLRRANCATD